MLEKDTPDQIEENNSLLRRNSIQNLFNGYEYDIEQLRHQLIQEKRKSKYNKSISLQKSTDLNSAAQDPPQFEQRD